MKKNKTVLKNECTRVYRNRNTYIYIHIYVDMYIYTYIYIYMNKLRDKKTNCQLFMKD